MSNTASSHNELYPGVKLRSVRIFIIEQCREYYNEGFLFPQSYIIADDCYRKFYDGNEPDGEPFPEWLMNYKYEEVKKYYKNKVIERQLTLLF